jgi:hypothetical protein
MRLLVELVKKIAAFYGIRWFVAVLAAARLRSLSGTRNSPIYVFLVGSYCI